MSMTVKKLWFTEVDPVIVLATPAARTPNVDGFVDNRTTDVVSSETQDFGYATGPRIEYASGVPQYPDVILSATKGTGEDFVYLHVNVQADQDFDDIDRVVVALRPRFAPLSPANQAIRIDIAPLSEGLGATAPGPVPTPLPAPPDIHRNHVPTIEVWKGTNATSGPKWTSVATPAALKIRSRSWRLPTPPAPYKAENGWGVEIKLPLNKAEGGSDWEDLSANFALYVDVIRVQRDPTPVTSEGYFCTQFTFPTDETQSRYLIDAFDSSLAIPDRYYGEGILGGTTPPQGLRFKRNAYGIPEIGVLKNGAIQDEIKLATTAVNEFRAIVMNTDPSNDGPAQLTAEFRIANWGVNSYSSATWDVIPATGGSNPADVPSPIAMGGGTGTGQFQWQLTQNESNHYAARKHQCMWVRLDAPGGDANLVESGARVNMNFVPLSEHSEVAEVSARGIKRIARRKEHDFRLFVHARLLALNKDMIHHIAGERGLIRGSIDDTRAWAWYVKGYRNIHKTLEINGIKTDLYQDVGAFGHVLVHEGPTDTIKFEFDGLNEVGPGIYDVAVPHDDAIEFKYRIWSEETEKDEWIEWTPKGDRGDDPGKEEPIERFPIRWPKEWWKRHRLIRFPGDTRPFPRPPR